MRTSEKAAPPCMPIPSVRRAELERFEAQLAEWTALIGQLRASARRGGGRDRLELDGLTDQLQRLRNEAGAQVLRLKAAADAEWDQERTGLEEAWQSIHASFRKARARC